MVKKKTKKKLYSGLEGEVATVAKLEVVIEPLVIKKKIKKKLYFGPEVEDAIIRFNKEEDIIGKNKIYANEIHAALLKLTENVINVYKFTNIIDIENFKYDCISHLYVTLEKFNPEKGTKAFSYFNAITKNFFIQKYKKQATRNRRNLKYEDMIFSQKNMSDNKLLDLPRIGAHKYKIEKLIGEMKDSWLRAAQKENDIQVIQSVIHLFESVEDIDVISKKSIYIFIREMTGLKTKQISNSLSKLQRKYGFFIHRLEDETNGSQKRRK